MVTRGGGEGEIQSSCLIGLEFQICKMKKFWGLFHNGKKSNVNILNTIVHLKIAKVVNFLLHIFTTNFLKFF